MSCAANNRRFCRAPGICDTASLFQSVAMPLMKCRALLLSALVLTLSACGGVDPDSPPARPRMEPLSIRTDPASISDRSPVDPGSTADWESAVGRYESIPDRHRADLHRSRVDPDRSVSTRGRLGQRSIQRRPGADPRSIRGRSGIDPGSTRIDTRPTRIGAAAQGSTMVPSGSTRDRHGRDPDR